MIRKDIIEITFRKIFFQLMNTENEQPINYDLNYSFSTY